MPVSLNGERVSVYSEILQCRLFFKDPFFVWNFHRYWQSILEKSELYPVSNFHSIFDAWNENHIEDFRLVYEPHLHSFILSSGKQD
jgi:hypothetical protein